MFPSGSVVPRLLDVLVAQMHARGLGLDVQPNAAVDLEGQVDVLFLDLGLAADFRERIVAQDVLEHLDYALHRVGFVQVVLAGLEQVRDVLLQAL